MEVPLWCRGERKKVKTPRLAAERLEKRMRVFRAGPGLALGFLIPFIATTLRPLSKRVANRRGKFPHYE